MTPCPTHTKISSGQGGGTSFSPCLLGEPQTLSPGLRAGAEGSSPPEEKRGKRFLRGTPPEVGVTWVQGGEQKT